MQTNCPCCGNHCPADQLRCRRGVAYFNGEGERRAPEMPSDEIILMLRKCGHFLHHGGAEAPRAVKSLTQEERETLLALLGKCYREWTE